ncbi:MAG: Mrp/NBP35 family ATP-binding protein [Bacteroidales bacterium]|jgi:ATP-binding protein involved in chromosome partitioning|nr:Mrp/NBP35 family ATP-binding protein [Bacteroidales bacterium]MBQ6100974.1 Mrp/NBP35 family ATP-binding protein [Bacteroidales bacterium]
MLNKENVIEVLKDVIYFPKGDNIVALNMVENLMVSESGIRFDLVVEKADDPKNEIMVNAAKRTLTGVFGEVEIDIKVKEAATALSKVKHIIAVASGKGGVGKSTVAANLAIALARANQRVGLIDADIYGPSVPMMFGVEHEQPACFEKDGKAVMVPLEKYGIKLLSIGCFVDTDRPLIWRGPMATSALNQLMNDTLWGELDWMVVDMPPGTGDIQLTLAQQYNVSGAVIVTTPQKVAFADVLRAAMMFKEEALQIPIYGLVENMAYFTPSDMPEKKYYIFGKETGKQFADQLGVPLLGQIPIVEKIAECGDKGTPLALDADSPVTKAFDQIAQSIINA